MSSVGSREGKVVEVVKLFLKLGATAFGGPAAHIGMMHDEVVKRRGWLNDVDLIGATNLIPGPNSTEMAMHVGYLRAGWRGLILGGVCFVAPAMAIVLVLAWTYVSFGTLPQAAWLLYGVKPAIIAVILQALWSLGRKAIKSALTAGVMALVLILYFVGVNEILLLAVGGVAVGAASNWRRVLGAYAGTLLLPSGIASIASQKATAFSMLGLFLNLLKIGAVWYGSGYVLLAFLRADFVERLGWLTDQQLIDAVAIGQVTPGPFLTAATFIGYLLGGIPGGLLATLAICIPSCVFVAISNPLIPRIRRSKLIGSMLDGVNVAALGLMAAVTWQLGHASLVDPLTMVIAAASLVVLLRFRINNVWVIGGGAVVGLVRSLLF